MRPEPAPVTAAVATLRAAGERVTPARRAVLGVLEQSRGHLDAEAIAAQVGDREPGVHRATVYRTLQSLVTLGVVAHTHVPGGSTIYHLSPSCLGASDDHVHAHLQCTSCLRFFDMPAEWLDELRESALKTMGFEIAPGHAALLGICSKCRESPAATGPQPHSH